MSFENLPTATSTTKAKKVSVFAWRNIITGILAVGLLGTWSYIYVDKKKNQEVVVQKDLAVTSISTEKDNLQKELDNAALRFDALKTESAGKDKQISEKDKDIAQKKARIQQLLSKQNATATELAQAKQLIASLNTDITSYQTQLATLKTENQNLVQEKTIIIHQRDKVMKDYDSATVVIKKKEDMIDVGSTLHASNFNIIGVTEKKNGKEKETTTAKRVDKLRISFDLDENRISASGKKDLYVRITAPDGKPVTDPGMGSGKISTREGNELDFTQKVGVEYIQGQRQTVNIDWKQNDKFETGDYMIEVYQNGFKIGEGIRHFKKGGLFS